MPPPSAVSSNEVSSYEERGAIGLDSPLTAWMPTAYELDSWLARQRHAARELQLASQRPFLFPRVTERQLERLRLAILMARRHQCNPAVLRSAESKLANMERKFSQRSPVAKPSAPRSHEGASVSPSEPEDWPWLEAPQASSAATRMQTNWRSLQARRMLQLSIWAATTMQSAARRSYEVRAFARARQVMKLRGARTVWALDADEWKRPPGRGTSAAGVVGAMRTVQISGNSV